MSPLPAPPVAAGHENLTDPLELVAAEAPRRVLYSRMVDRSWTDVTARDFRDDVAGVAKGLVGMGIEPGDRVAIMSRTRYEWTLTDYALWYAGAVTVPIYETSSPDQVAWILSDSGCSAIVVENAELASTIQDLRADLPALTHDPVVLDDGGLDRVRDSGGDVTDEALEERRHAAGAADPATIVYTSGTTGRPKGCVLTHGNFLFELRSAIVHLPEAFAPGSSTLLFLPLAHVFARIVQVASVMGGLQVAFSQGLSHLTEELGSFRPTFLLAMPRVFEKVYNSAYAKAAEKSPVARRIFNLATATAIAHSAASLAGSVSPLLKARHALFSKLVYSKLREALGGRATMALSGSAPLPDRLNHFFRGIGLNVVEGYGLTECCAATSCGRFSDPRVGTVGQPLPGVEIRVADDGEIEVKGPHVFREYLNNPEASAEAMTADGFLRTGDLGSLSEDGFIRITGRKKELLVTASGKNVSPAPMEDAVAADPLVGNVLVVGDGQPYVAALVTLDPDAATFWARQHGKSEDIATLAADPDVHAHVEAAVARANGSVSRAESIRRFEILPNTWTIETGELTPSLKLKRGHVFKQHGDVIDRMYLSKPGD